MALNPATPAVSVGEILGNADLVLVMTVNPGFGGQAFISSTVHKIAQVRRMLDEIGSGADLEVDGGIDRSTAGIVVRAGATMLVAGNAVFAAEEGVGPAIAAIRQVATQAEQPV